MFTLIGLLACLCLANAAITPYLGYKDPKDGKVLALHYTATVTAGQNEPLPYGSNLYIESEILIINDYKSTIDSDKKFSYVKFHNAKHAIYNGPNNDHPVELHLLSDDLKAFETPFLIIKNKNDEEVIGIHLEDNEPVWSKNIKKSLASKFRTSEYEKHEDFHNHAHHVYEKTIHGNCKVDLSIYTKERNGKKLHYIKKFYEPWKCSNFYYHYVNNGKTMDCRAEFEGDLLSTVEKVSEFETMHDGTVQIKKINFHEKMSYLPWQSRTAGIQFVETNQTIVFSKEPVKISDSDLPSINFRTIPILEHLSFNESDYSGLNKELYFGRHSFTPRDTVPKVTDLLLKTLEYLKDDNLDEKKTNPKYNDIIGKLHNYMKLLDAESMWNIYNDFNVESEKGSMSRKLFLEVLPHVGTRATWRFVKNVIIKNKMPDEKTIIKVLNQLALYTENPTEEFVLEMKDYLNIGKQVSAPVHRAAVLCYSILLDAVSVNFKNHSFNDVFKDILTPIREESDYESKIANILAMRNIKSGYTNLFALSLHTKGSITFDDYADPKRLEQSRIAVMWAVAESVRTNKDQTYEYFWPILTNESEPLPIRITAYEQLITRNPIVDSELLMQVHSLMAEEKDEHLFNYHYTTLQFMSESKDPCMKPVAKIMRKILRITQKRERINSPMSAVDVYDYFDDFYGHGKTLRMSVGINDNSGFPQIGYYEEITNIGRRRQMNKGYYWHVDGFSINSILKLLTDEKLSRDLVLEEVGIANEQIKNILRKTHGHQVHDNKPIHIELWTVTNGYVNDIKIFNEETLQEFIRDMIKEYKPDSIMDIDKFNRNWLDVSFLNHYKGIVATDLGIPVLFHNEVPSLSYVKIKPTIAPSRSSITASLEFETRYYRHISYQMGFYNPFADVTHAVVRQISVDASYPIQVTASMNLANRNFKILIPRLPETRYSSGGLKIYSLDQVKIVNDFSYKLSTYCSACQHEYEISKSSSQGSVEHVVHSATTGLEYKTAIFDCENYDTPGEEYKELFRIFSMEQNNLKHVPGIELYLKADNALVNFFNNPFTAKCGALMKVSPSKVYPTSHIEMNWRFNTEESRDHTKLSIRGTIDTKAQSTKDTTILWKMNINTDLSETLHNIKLHFTRVVSGEAKNLQVCFDATKKWPSSFEEVNKHPVTDASFDLNMGYSSKDRCIYDDSFIKIKVLGEHSEQQKEHMKQMEEVGLSCFKNVLKFNSDKLFDWNCLRDTIEATTLRQYNIEAKYQNVPHELVATLVSLEDLNLRHAYIPHISYKPNHTEPGVVKASVTYNTDFKYLNFTVMYPTYSYEVVGVRHEPEVKSEVDSDVILDNIVFSSIHFLIDYYKNEMRPCIAHSNELINDLNQVMPMDFKDWTLMYGDYEFMTYAVFVKKYANNKVAVRLYVSNHILELTPRGVTFDGLPMDIHNLAMINLPDNNKPIIKLKKVYKVFTLVEVEKILKAKIIYTPYNAIVLPKAVGDKTIDGVCGHLGTTIYAQQYPLIYSSL